MYRTDFWTLWEKARVEWSETIALKRVYYQVWNRSPVQVGCMRQMLKAGALGWPSLSSNNNMQIHSVQQLLPTSFCPVLWYCYSTLYFYTINSQNLAIFVLVDHIFSYLEIGKIVFTSFLSLFQTSLFFLVEPSLILVWYSSSL